MRAELKKARIAEARANNDKKELVAKLSHDIKTPVASIKAASEVGAALACDVKNKDNYIQIIHKADQINALITNLFTATLEELQQLTVSPEDISSRDLGAMLQNSDYLHRADIPCIPDCLLHADRLRLQQVFDNIFVNSYKYADSPISLTIILGDRYLSITAEDHGTALPREELIHIKEKFWRGSNTQNIEGAGLGLFISDYFIKNEAVENKSFFSASYFLRQLKPATDPVNKLGPPRLSLLLNCLPVLRIQEFFRLIHHIS